MSEQGAQRSMRKPGESAVRRPANAWYFNGHFVLALRLALAAVFIYAGLQKIGRPLAFADEIRMYHILDIGPLLYIMAITLPWIELLCGLSLVTGIFMRGSALILLALNVVFLVAVSLRTVGIMSEEGIGFTSVYFDCGCGFGTTYAWKKLLEDAAFFLFSVVILFVPEYRFVLTVSRRSL
jgi:putative oxidoreductase